MTQEEKDLLLKDLAARLPYNTKVFFSIIEEDEPVELSLSVIRCLESIPLGQNDIVIKPYLRPMSSMTEEERNEYLSTKMQETERVALAEVCRPEAISEIMDWLNAHHFDYRGLIPKGLAIEVTENNNSYKE